MQYFSDSYCPKEMMHHGKALMKSELTATEWEYAKEYFSKNPTHSSLKRQEHPQLQHSFLNTEGNIFALGRGKITYLGEGNFGKVKLAFLENDEKYAVKIEA